MAITPTPTGLPAPRRDATCTAPRCGNPTTDFVCPLCITQLRRDLWALAGHPGHRGGPIAPNAAEQRQQVDAHRGLVAELVVTMARQDDAPGGHTGSWMPDPDLEWERTDEPIASTALPYQPAAATMLAEIRGVLNMWVRVLLERRYGTELDALARDVAYRRSAGLGAHGPWRRGPELPDPEPAELAWWLGRHRQTVACDPDGGRLVAEVGALVPRAAAVVSPRRWEYLGPCLHWHCEAGPHQCQLCADEKPGEAEHLYAPAGADWVSCRPCGRSYDVAVRRRWLLQQAEDQLVTAEFAADALPRYLSPDLGRLLEPRRIRRWAEHGRITVHRPHPGETVLDTLGRQRPAPVRYKVADLIEQVSRDAERPGRRSAAVRDDAAGDATHLGQPV